jgi:hypothetical protein
MELKGCGKKVHVLKVQSALSKPHKIGLADAEKINKFFSRKR